MKKIIHLLFVISLVFLATGCGKAVLSPKEQAYIDDAKPLYTQVGMWADKGVKIYGTNYSRGEFIPVNSEITIKKIKSSTINIIYNQRSMVIVNTKFTQVGINTLLAKLLGEEKVDLSKFSEKEQKNVLKGKLEIGMSKNAAILARGYPPAHKTPSLELNDWRYWLNRFNTNVYQFKDDKIYNIIK